MATVPSNEVRRFKEITLPRTLSLGSVLRLLPYFVPAKMADDPLQLGWRLADPGRWPMISTSKLESISAEAIAALGAMRGAFDDERTTTLTMSPTHHAPCDRILNGLRPESGNWELLPGGGAALLLREVVVANIEDVERVADVAIKDLLQAPGEAGRELRALREVLRRLLTEALMNVQEHAYAKGTTPRAWLAAVCLPSGAVRKMHLADEILAPEEGEWLKTIGDRQVLELAIADAGVGIAATLSPSAATLLPSLVSAAMELSSGRREFRSLRSKIHMELCGYAFHHASTSRGTDEKKFPTEHHKLNWRGLYRCYRQVAELGGGISVTSGRARAGYTATSRGTSSFEAELPVNGEYPGTIISIRLPLPARPRPAQTSRSTGLRTPLKIDGTPLPWDKLVKMTDDGLQFGTAKVSSHSRFVPVALPFVNFTPDPNPSNEHFIAIYRLRTALDTLQQDLVPVFCFGGVPEGWRDNLRAFVPSGWWHSSLHGPPRLVGLLGHDEAIQWVFAGAIPLEAEAALTQLEGQGSCELPTTAPEAVRKLLTELIAHYRDIMTWDVKTRVVRLHCHGAWLQGEDYRSVLTTAFSQYWQRESVQNEVITEIPGKVILLPNGIQVRRHFSVFKLLNQSPDLTLALGRKFGDLVRETAPPNHSIIVLDQPASSYIVHALLEGADLKIDVLTIEQVVRRELAGYTLLLFADCIFKGDTARASVEELRRLGFQVARVIACVDLRFDSQIEKMGDAPFFALACPEDVHVTIVSEPMGEDKIIRTDALTHMAVLDATRSAFVQLTKHEGRLRLLATHEKLFCAGFQYRGGRTHTYSLPLANLLGLDNGRHMVTSWLCETAYKLSETLGLRLDGKDVVLFTWFESRMSGLVDHLAERLREPPWGATGTFVVRMPVAHRGSDTIYPHAGSNPLDGCTEIATGRLAYDGRRLPKRGYVALYLADSAVTGNSLRDFLHRLVTAARPEADAAIALIGINRLSPAELRFFDLCQHLSKTNGGTALPFALDSLFNLQIRSRAGLVPVWHLMLEAVFSDPAMRVAKLRDYIENLQLRTAKLDSIRGLLHPFFPTNCAHTVSADAVRFRHLLALNQQNEPVVLEILALLERLTSEETDDPSIIVVLALEPVLLQDPPLRNFGRQSLIRMAERILLCPKMTVAIKTDALVVLASFPNALRKHLPNVAEEVLGHETLRLAAAALLLALQRMHNQPAQAVIESCFTHLSSDVRLHADHLCHLLAVCTDIQNANSQPERQQELRRVIERLCSHLLHHAAALEDDWDGVGTELDILANRWTRIAKPARRVAGIEACRRGISFAEGTLLPAFHSLAYYARGCGEPHLAAKLEDHAVYARSLLAALRNRIPRNPEDMTQGEARSIDSAFQALRLATWFGPTSERLLRGEAAEFGSGPLADCLPRLFCAPADLLVLLADEVFDSPTEIEEIAEMIGMKSSTQLTVAPIPVKTLRHIFTLLLTNIRKHGVPRSLTAKLSTSAASDGSQIWSLELVNTIDPASQPGERMGIETASGAAAPFGVRVESSPLNAGHSWRTVVSIPHCFRLHNSTESRLP